MPSVREVADRALYNEILEAMATFREVHFGWAQQYVHQWESDPRGTGGTPYVKWLRQLIERNPCRKTSVTAREYVAGPKAFGSLSPEAHPGESYANAELFSAQPFSLVDDLCGLRLGLKGEPLARWADRVCISVRFPKAMPRAGRTAPLRGRAGLFERPPLAFFARQGNNPPHDPCNPMFPTEEDLRRQAAH